MNNEMIQMGNGLRKKTTEYEMLLFVSTSRFLFYFSLFYFAAMLFYCTEGETLWLCLPHGGAP